MGLDTDLFGVEGDKVGCLQWCCFFCRLLIECDRGLGPVSWVSRVCCWVCNSVLGL